MRRIKFLTLLAFAVSVAVSFNACKGGDDGDGDEKSGDSYLIEDSDGWKYTVSFSELKDNGSEMSFTESFKYILPEDATVKFEFSYQYEEQPSDSTVTEAVTKDSYPITGGVVTVTSSSESLADSIYAELVTDKSYTIEKDGKIERRPVQQGIFRMGMQMYKCHG